MNLIDDIIMKLRRYIRSFIHEYLRESITDGITYSNILSNIDIVKNKNLTKQLLLLSHSGLSGGIKAVWNYADENPSKVVIAFHRNKPIGVITITNNDQNIFIDHKYRKLGIGTRLKDIIYNRKSI